MSGSPRSPTLEQLNVFLHVVESGSFTGAANALHRALSAVSYTIANLESQLGVALFDRSSSRKPKLTDAGRLVLAEARTVMGGVGNLRAKVAGLLSGLESELHVAVDCLMPEDRVADALKGLCDEHPSVSLHLYMETLGAVAQMVLNRTAVVGISGPFTSDFDEFDRISVGTLRMVAVASPDHALARMEGLGRLPGAIREHLQLVVYDRSPLTHGHDFSVRANRTWRLADISVKLTLLRSGVGWGMMPLRMVEHDLSQGRLVQLDLPDLPSFDYPVDAIYRSDTPPGPVARWLIERFRNQIN